MIVFVVRARALNQANSRVIPAIAERIDRSTEFHRAAKQRKSVESIRLNWPGPLNENSAESQGTADEPTEELIDPDESDPHQNVTIDAADRVIFANVLQSGAMLFDDAGANIGRHGIGESDA